MCVWGEGVTVVCTGAQGQEGVFGAGGGERRPEYEVYSAVCIDSASTFYCRRFVRRLKAARALPLVYVSALTVGVVVLFIGIKRTSKYYLLSKPTQFVLFIVEAPSGHVGIKMPRDSMFNHANQEVPLCNGSTMSNVIYLRRQGNRRLVSGSALRWDRCRLPTLCGDRRRVHKDIATGPPQMFIAPTVLQGTGMILQGKHSRRQG